ncbi:MAG: hypothetical protein KatS3mg060_1109 [Dehalococcoidia bacterium]|nr:MAG: hypothetical protein KatS3mg060_1109 [Dehalococcoidia bacterium]
MCQQSPLEGASRTGGDRGYARFERGPERLDRGSDRYEPLPERSSGIDYPPARSFHVLRPRRIYPFGISRSRLEQAIREMQVPASIVDSVDQADVVMTLKSYYRQRNPGLRDAEVRGIPVFVLKQNTVLQMEQSLGHMFDIGAIEGDPVASAQREAEEAIDEVLRTGQPVELTPQNAFIRRLQHEIAERYQVGSESTGREPHRRVRIFRDAAGP